MKKYKRFRKTDRLEVNEDGVLQRLDQDGNVMWTQGDERGRKPKDESKYDKPKRGRDGYVRECVVRDGLGNEVSVPVKIKPTQLLNGKTNYPFNDLTAEMICQEVANGKTLTAISKTPGFPPFHTIRYWIGKFPHFKKAIAEARAARAEYYHDKIHDLAEDVDEDTAKSARVKLEAYKHLSAVNDPDTYGQRIKHTGDPSAPIGFIVDTGIRREGEEDKSEEEESLEHA